MVAAAAAAVRRCAKGLQAARLGLPELSVVSVSPAAPPSPADVGAAAVATTTTTMAPLLTSAHAAALAASRARARALRDDLETATKPLADGERALVAPLLKQLRRLGAEEEEKATGQVVASGELDAAMEEATEGAMEQGGGGGVGAGAVAVVGAVERAVVQLMLSLQSLRKHSAAPPKKAKAREEAAGEEAEAEEEEEEEEVTSLKEEHNHLLKLFGAARGRKVGEAVGAVLASLRDLADSGGGGDGGGGGGSVEAAAGLAAQLCPGLAAVLSAMQWAVHQAIAHHAESVRLELVLCNLFLSLFSDGFCTAPEQGDEGGDGSGGGQNQQKLDDDVEGTGMGEGEGKKDVSDELQEEGQLDAPMTEKEKEEKERQEEQDGGKDKEEERADEDEGVDMTNDFEGAPRRAAAASTRRLHTPPAARAPPPPPLQRQPIPLPRCDDDHRFI